MIHNKFYYIHMDNLNQMNIYQYIYFYYKHNNYKIPHINYYLLMIYKYQEGMIRNKYFYIHMNNPNQLNIFQYIYSYYKYNNCKIPRINYYL